MPTRPTSVPDTATIIYPGEMFGPGLGVQQATILKIEAQVASANAAAMQRYAAAMGDWVTNAQIYAGYGMPIPPPPVKPATTELEVVYADASGNVVPAPTGSDGSYYAWVWEVSAS